MLQRLRIAPAARSIVLVSDATTLGKGEGEGVGVDLPRLDVRDLSDEVAAAAADAEDEWAEEWAALEEDGEDTSTVWVCAHDRRAHMMRTLPRARERARPGAATSQC